MAKVVSRGRYMPTDTSMGLRTCMRMKARPIIMPTMMSGQAIFPSTMPRLSRAMRPAWGAASCLEPKPASRDSTIFFWSAGSCFT